MPPRCQELPLIQAAAFSYHNYAAFSISVALIGPHVPAWRFTGNGSASFSDRLCCCHSLQEPVRRPVISSRGPIRRLSRRRSQELPASRIFGNFPVAS